MEDRNYYRVDEISSTTLPPPHLEVQQFGWAEYLVFSSVLALSVGIGIFYWLRSKDSNEEYLLGSRQMHPVPVALSLLCSYVSSITLLGHPVEIYLYGTQLFLVLLCYIPLTWSLAYLFVPLYFNLQITSVYEYLELRFNKHVRTALSLINVIYTIFYMSMVVYGPAIALSIVTKLNHRLLVAIIFLVCIFYSTVGGYKAVLITDSLQAVVMFVSMAAVVVLGIVNIDGGFSEIWERAENSGRISFLNFDPDPRTRHTVWTAIVGGYFTWLPMYANQAQIQRYISLPSLLSVKKALLINLVGLAILMGGCYICGLVIYGTYYNCDPLYSGRVMAVDQLLPIFVMDTLGSYKGLPGLFVAGITCAGLSTVSSGVNALAASITEDYVRKWRPNLTDRQLSYVSKGTALVTGLLAFGFVFIAEQMGSIFSAATTILGILGGPTLGIFITGQMFPYANSWGAVTGMILSFSFMSFLGIGATIAGNKGLLPNQVLSLDTSGCDQALKVLGHKVNTAWKSKGDSVLVQILSLSYLWYPAVGCLTAILFGCLFSVVYRLIYGTEHIAKVPSKLFIPNILRIWVKCMPQKIHSLVSFEEGKLLSPSASEKSINASRTNLPLDNIIPPLNNSTEKRSTML